MRLGDAAVDCSAPTTGPTSPCGDCADAAGRVEHSWLDKMYSSRQIVRLGDATEGCAARTAGLAEPCGECAGVAVVSRDRADE